MEQKNNEINKAEIKYGYLKFSDITITVAYTKEKFAFAIQSPKDKIFSSKGISTRNLKQERNIGRRIASGRLIKGVKDSWSNLKHEKLSYDIIFGHNPGLWHNVKISLYKLFMSSDYIMPSFINDYCMYILEEIRQDDLI